MKKNSFTYNTLFMTSANIVTRMTGFLYRIFLSRFIGAEGLGLFSLVSPVYAIACAIVASGIPVSAMKLISEHTAKKEYGKAKYMTLISLRLVFYVSLVLFFAILILAKPLSHLVGDTRTYPSFLILSLAVLITGFENIYKSSFYSLGIVKVPGLCEIAEQIFRIICVIFLALNFAKGNITISSFILTLGIFLGELLSLIILYFSYKSVTKNHTAKKVEGGMKEVLSTAVPVTIGRTGENMLSSISNILVPFLLVRVGLSKSEALSVLGVISGMIMPLLYMPSVFTNALSVNLVPFISGNLAKGNYLAIKRKLKKSLFITSLFCSPAVMGMILFKDEIAKYIFSDSRVAIFLPMMALGSFFASFRHLGAVSLNASGLAKKSSLYSLLGNAFEIALLFILIPIFRVYGFSLSYLIINVVLTIPTFIDVFTSLKLDFSTIMDSFIPLLPSIAAFYIVNMIRACLPPFMPGLLYFFYLAFLTVIIYLLLLFIMLREKKIIFFAKKT